MLAIAPSFPFWSRLVLPILNQEFIEDQWAGEEGKAGRIEDDGARDDGGGKENEEERVLYGIPDSRIRKIISGRQAAAKRWRKVGSKHGPPHRQCK